MTNHTHLPPELCPPLCDIDSEEYISNHRCEDNEAKPAVKCYDKVDDSHAYVHQSRGYVEEDVTEEVVDALSATIHHTKHLTCVKQSGQHTE